MALVLADRVLETTTTTGSGTITLAGAEPGYQSFSAVGDGNQTYYTITGDTEWEVGIGTYTASGTTLSRDTVLSSSNSGAKVTFSAGTKNVFVTYPSEKSVNRDVSGNISAASGVITNVAAPTSPSDAATKLYVDSLAEFGITYHTPVKYEVPNSTGNLVATYNNGTAGVSATLTNAGTLAAFVPDGVTASISDRVLVYSQTNGFENGVYTVTVVGDGSTAWVLTRASDADTYALKSPNSLGGGDAFFVTSGNTGAGETYICNNSGVISFGSTAISFVQISSAQVYKAGNGISLTNTTISLDTPVAVANGGTGSSSTPTNGQLLIGNGSGYTLSTLTAGSGVSITNSAGSITLSATGLGGTVTAVTATGPLASSGGTTPDISIANTTGTGSVVLDQGATISSATITAALSASITTITGTSANITTVTGTTTTFSSGTISQLGATSATITTLSGTNVTYSSGTVSQLAATSATIASVSGTNVTYSNGNFTSATVSTISGTTATYTSATVTNLNVTSVTLSNLSIASANITTLTGTTFGTTATTQLRANSLAISTTGAKWNSNGDIYAVRSGGTTGVIYLGSSGGRYLYYDGTSYQMPGANLFVNGVQVASATITTGNLAFTGTGQRITGDMSNATWTSRVFFQSSTANGNTNLFVVPNGTSTISQVASFGASDVLNSAYFGLVQVGTTDSRLQAAASGTGTFTPMTFYTNGSERFRIGTSGQFGIGGANYGTSGQVLTSNGSGSAPSWQTAGGSSLKSQTFTASGTFTVPTGVTSVWVTMTGGGSSGCVQAFGAVGGASGAYCFKRPFSVTAGASLTVTIGGGGAGTATGDGNNGSDTSFSSLTISGGIAASTTGSRLGIGGSNGGSANGSNTGFLAAGSSLLGGRGGAWLLSTYIFGGGGGGFGNGTDGGNAGSSSAAANSGAGSGGCKSGTTGAGGSGMVIVEWLG